MMKEMPDVLITTWDSLSSEDLIFVVGLSISVLVMLYAVSLVNSKIRLLENEMQSVRNDQSVISNELETLATIKGNAESAKRSKKL